MSRFICPKCSNFAGPTLYESSILDKDRSQMFRGMDSEYLQNSLFRNEFGLLVSILHAL